MTTPAAPARATDPAVDTAALPFEVLLDGLLDDVDTDRPGMYLSTYFVRAQSADATLAAIAAVAAKITKRVPDLAVHTYVTAYTDRDGDDPHWCETHRRFFCDLGPREGNPYAAHCYAAPCAAREIQVRAEGLPMWDGAWRVAGILTRDGQGAVTSTTISDDDAQAMMSSRGLMGECAHCGKVRARSTTIILVDGETGEVRPVGKSCLAEYTGGALRPDVLATLTGLGERFAAEVGGVLAHVGDSAPVVDVVALAARYVARYGFVRSNDPIATPTAAAVRYALTWDGENGPRPEVMAGELTADDRAAAAADVAVVLDDALDTDRDLGSEYLANLRAVCAETWTEYTGKRNRVGLLASLPGTAARRREFAARQTARAAEKASEVDAFIGAEKDRREFTGRVLSHRLLPDNGWGQSELFVVSTGEGVVKLMGKVPSFRLVEPGTIVTFTATIKAHETYQGAKSTRVTRMAKLVDGNGTDLAN